MAKTFYDDLSDPRLDMVSDELYDFLGEMSPEQLNGLDATHMAGLVEMAVDIGKSRGITDPAAIADVVRDAARDFGIIAAPTQEFDDPEHAHETVMEHAMEIEGR